MPEVPRGAPTQDYRGTRLGVTPVYAPRASGSVRSQQAALARRLVEIRQSQEEALARRLVELQRSL